MKKETLRFEIEKERKELLEKILTELGMTLEEAIHLFLKQVELKRGIPFDLILPTPCAKSVNPEEGLKPNKSPLLMTDANEEQENNGEERYRNMGI